MEQWDIYDRQGNLTGRVKKKHAVLAPGEFHLAMEAWIVNSNQQILVQKRSEQCEILPGKWALTTGRMVAGEDSLSGCVREIGEELGISVQKQDIHFITRIFQTDSIWDLYWVKKDIAEDACRLQAEEVAGVRWVTVSEFRRMMEQGEMFRYPEIEDILDRIEREAMK